jgi:hypothetical protein
MEPELPSYDLSIDGLRFEWEGKLLSLVLAAGFHIFFLPVHAYKKLASEYLKQIDYDGVTLYLLFPSFLLF